MVNTAKKHIKAGDVFQIVLSNRLKVKAKIDRLSFYRKLRSKNPSPYLYYLDIDDFAIIGSSPEVMVRLNEGMILLRPIAGTRKRGDTLKKDLEMEQDMLNDPKEVAEHIMLVDLGRNDVGRVSKAGSVKVEELMRVERYSHVMHLVSDVVAELDEKYDMFDLFKATFTAGTMTGAPKIKAMELIAKYEGIKRGYYAGSVGYFGFDGNMDTAITIRTALVKDNEIIFQAGAGVVADSKPELEYKEVNNKLGALVATLQEL
jgi:anthranilate synthase component 1